MAMTPLDNDATFIIQKSHYDGSLSAYLRSGDRTDLIAEIRRPDAHDEAQFKWLVGSAAAFHGKKLEYQP